MNIFGTGRYTTDVTLQSRLKQVVAGTARPHWSYRDGLLLYKGRLFLQSISPLIPAILYEFHSSTHEGSAKFLQLLKSSFYWHGILSGVLDFIRKCAVCQRNKAEHCKPSGLLQSLPIPTMVWSDLSMDFIDGLPKVMTSQRSKGSQLFWLSSIVFRSTPISWPYVTLTQHPWWFECSSITLSGCMAFYVYCRSVCTLKVALC